MSKPSFCRFWGVPFLVGLFFFPSWESANAARVTEVADALDDEDPFDVQLEFRYEFLRHTALISRENYQEDEYQTKRLMHARELKFEEVQHRVVPRLELGIFIDLAIYARLPIVFEHERKTSFASGTDSSNSTLVQSQSPNPTQSVDGWPGNAYGYPGTPYGHAYNDWRFDMAGGGAYNSHRSGPDNPTFGMRWSPTNNERQNSSPSITLDFGYTAPFFAPMEPAVEIATEIENGLVADGAHRFHVEVAMSKRYRLLDPYFLVNYTGPAPSSDAVHGFYGQHQGGFRLGIEILPYEEPGLSQKLGLDFFAGAVYFAEGRTYSELSDALYDLNYVEQFMRTEAGAGVYFQAGPFIQFDFNVGMSYDTDHLLTAENIGTDIDNNGFVDLDPTSPEINPFYNPVLDTPGRRLRVEESLAFQVMLHAALMF